MYRSPSGEISGGPLARSGTGREPSGAVLEHLPQCAACQRFARSERRLWGEPPRPHQRGVQQFVVLDDAVDEAELERFLGEDRVECLADAVKPPSQAVG